MAVSRQRISHQQSAISGLAVNGQPSAVGKEDFLLIKNLLLLTAESR